MIENFETDFLNDRIATTNGSEARSLSGAPRTRTKEHVGVAGA